MASFPASTAPATQEHSYKHRIPNQKHSRFAHDRFRDYLAHHDITIPIRELSWLRDKALRKWRHRNPDAVISDPVPLEFSNWIIVTWIRHQCCEYDATLRWFSPSLREQMRTRLKHHVLDLIGETYPELAEACSEQKQAMASRANRRR